MPFYIATLEFPHKEQNSKIIKEIRKQNRGKKSAAKAGKK